MNTFNIVLLLNLPFLIFCKPHNRLLDIDSVEKYLDQCYEGGEHKKKPSPEPQLEDCTEWKDNACCSPQIAAKLANDTLHGFTFQFCGEMDKECRKYFHYDYCMVRCSPHLGPWIVETTSKKLKERAFKVPLCESDCNDWYDACKNSKACATNWRSGGFDWSTGTNKCRDGYSCIEMSKIYGSAKAFCEQIFDSAYTVIPSDSVAEWNVTDYHCMHIPLGEDDPAAKSKIQHNEGVARRMAQVIIDRVYGN